MSLLSEVGIDVASAQRDATDLLVALAAIMFVSAVLQTTTGFGYAILSAPIATSLIGGPAAVSTILVVGTVVDVLIVCARRTPPRPRWKEVGLLAGFSVPGMALGVAALILLPLSAILLLIAVSVVLAVSLRLFPLRAPVQRPARISTWWSAPAGLLSGALATSTTLGGPPSVLYLSGRRYDPATTRDTLVVLNLVRLPISIVVLLAGGTFVVLPGLPWLALASIGGYLVGALVFRRLNPRRYEGVVLSALLLAAGCAVVVAFLPR